MNNEILFYFEHFAHFCEQYCELLDDLETAQQKQDFALGVFWPNVETLLEAENITDDLIRQTCYQFFLDVIEAGYDWYGTVDDTAEFLNYVWVPFVDNALIDYPPELRVDTELAQRTYEEMMREEDDPHTPYSSASSSSSSQSSESSGSTGLCFQQCSIHKEEYKKLYCFECNEMLCVYCHHCGDHDRNHRVCYYTEAKEETERLLNRPKRRLSTPYNRGTNVDDDEVEEVEEVERKKPKHE